MTLALVALASTVLLLALSRTRILARAAEAPALTLAAGGVLAFLYRGANAAFGAPGLPADIVAAAAETGLAALVFVSAAQIRVSRLAVQCPASFRLTLGGAPHFLVLCSLCAFVLLPQMSLASAMLRGGALWLNG
ncbi:MAG: hypothetical protein ABL957_12250, partial [Parvularculaceae bacterium]